MKEMIKRWLGISDNETELNNLHLEYRRLKSDHQKLLDQLKNHSTMTIDVESCGFNGMNSRITICSKVSGGYVEFVDLNINDACELRDIVANLRSQYGVMKEFSDLPRQVYI